MFPSHQASLFDVCTAEPSIGDLAGIQRTALTDGAWVDRCPNWITGSEVLFDDLVAHVPWRVERRRMYERVVNVPRLVYFYEEGVPLPNPLLTRIREALDRYYARELGEPFVTAGMCYYRDGSDSVAWHGDRIGRSSTEDTMVAILSLGDARPLMLRPRGGGQSLRFSVGHGDLLVMGGSCQRTWEHCVPKTSRPVGPRVSIQFRPHNVR
ncbi:alpha-ketoglutarate-dependent dioxygenase AlkB [Hoyosella sp. YIM 151337]|uniref:alpha-ketoglutarate-dependent dioxygenase AlkB n=1 Tax=Hoyosella sp. YIM 151337 TaxID=2992742 RepID=UPI0022358237|nr:alpha-ketoglutarate-dependent dioxygenase AlkB [Hoyosella sp. YIM 151337]MCW4354226.1 alpha-ketoglutarate-dependent dioxygenase AlkB [Hoyosella sp. YIM 151337]